MIIDAHNHIGAPRGFHKAQHAEDLVRTMDRLGIDRCVCFPFPPVYDLDNDCVIQAQRRFPDRIVGFAMVNPKMLSAREELRRLVETGGLRGLKLHPFLHGYQADNHAWLDPIYEECAALCIPIVIHSGDSVYCQPVQIAEMAAAFPTVPVIMFHSGFMWLTGQAIQAAKRHPNIYLETSAVMSGDVRAMVEAVGADRVVMGTDSPTSHHEVELKKLEVAIPDPQKRALVMGENLRRILRL